MKKKKWSKVLSVFLVMVTAVSLLSGCGGKSAEKEDGFYAVDFAFGPEEAMGAAMLVNTVPAPVVTRVIIKELPRDAYILDIASKPGGTDFACAKEFGIRADLVLGIPGKYAPKESAYILERSMERFAAK